MATPQAVPPPDLRDPRVMLIVPAAQRAVLTALWDLDARLFAVGQRVREPLLAQIRLAWWRDRLAAGAADPASVPGGEPLLARLGPMLPDLPPLAPLAEAHAAVVLADDDDARQAATAAAGQVLFALGQAVAVDAGAVAGGALWALVRAALQASAEGAAADALWQAAHDQYPAPSPARRRGAALAHAMVAEWARGIAIRRGARQPLHEGLMLARHALVGR